MTDDLAILENYINRCSNWGRWGRSNLIFLGRADRI
jgi:hypothetical protein